MARVNCNSTHANCRNTRYSRFCSIKECPCRCSKTPLLLLQDTAAAAAAAAAATAAPTAGEEAIPPVVPAALLPAQHLSFLPSCLRLLLPLLQHICDQQQQEQQQQQQQQQQQKQQQQQECHSLASRGTEDFLLLGSLRPTGKQNIEFVNELSVHLPPRIIRLPCRSSSSSSSKSRGRARGGRGLTRAMHHPAAPTH
ncbi:hypothetical protein Emed_000441 [Eimeria media]